MKDGVFSILAEAGIRIKVGERGWPSVNLPNFEVKILKPQNIVEMLDADNRDLGFAGDVGFKRRSQFGGACGYGIGSGPRGSGTTVVGRWKTSKQHRIASEYETLAAIGLNEKVWMRPLCVPTVQLRYFLQKTPMYRRQYFNGFNAEANNLDIVATVATSSTRLYANPNALEVPESR